MSDVTINTWRDLLFPNDQDARVSLLRIDRTRGQHSTAKTSSLSNPGIVPNQLPSNAYVVPNLPERMSEHLEILLDRHYSVQAATTSFTEGYSESLTPKGVFQSLQRNARNVNFRLNYEPGSSSIGPYLFSLVQIIYQALTESPRLSFDTEVHGPGDHVIGDFTYLIDNRITILVENKSPKVFDRFIGQFMEQGRDGRPISLCSESVATSYEGYKAIFGKLGYHASGVQPQVRWAIVFSGLSYVVVYIPRPPTSQDAKCPLIFCSPTMRFCLLPEGEQEDPVIIPPLWSLLVYILLVETRNIDDETLRRELGLVSFAVPTLESKTAQGRLCSGGLATTAETDESKAHSGALIEAPETMTVRCPDAYPLELTLVDTPTFHHAKKKCHPIVYLDRHLGGGWSTVYLSSKSHVVVKFAVAPGKDKAELKRQLTNEKIAYNKLSRITGWVVPCLYGEYAWHGRRALLLSDEGLSLSGTFTSLLLVERFILFAEVYCVHQLGVEHGDFEPRNVLRKKWSCFFKIIDFGFSNVNHTCPGWRKCGELKELWHSLELDRVNFRFKTQVVAGLGYLALLSVITFLVPLFLLATPGHGIFAKVENVTTNRPIPVQYW